MTDQTMRSLLEVHRAEVNDKDARILELERVNSGIAYDLDRVRRELDQSKAAVDRAEARTAEWKAKYDKRGGVIESLKLELAEVRTQFTKAREAGDHRGASE